MHFGPSQPFLYTRYMGARPINYLAQALTYPEPYHSSIDSACLPSGSSKSLWHDHDEKRAWAPYDGNIDTLSQENKTDPLERFFAGKRNFLLKSGREIVGLIYEREHLKYQNICRIDYDVCRTTTLLFEIDRWHPGVNPGIDRIRTNIERELLAFEREKRMEEVACWRDFCRLKSDLREVTREFERENQREALMSGGK